MVNKLKKIQGGHLYISSSGKETLLSQMTYPHLENAIKKLEREDVLGEHEEELTILKDELKSRPAQE